MTPLLIAAMVSTSPVAPGNYDGAWEVKVYDHGNVESSVFDSEGELVAGPFAAKSFTVPEVAAWNDENPVWYVLRTVKDGAEEETVFGFAEKKLTDGGFYVNGRKTPLKFGPKALNGNAAKGGEIAREVAWKEGYYILPEGVEAPGFNESPSPLAMFHAFQNWSVKGTNFNQRFTVKNKNVFTDASKVVCRWHLLLDGEEEDDGEVDLYGLGPGEEATYDMMPEALGAAASGKTVSVRFIFENDEGHEIAADQIDLVSTRELDTLKAREGWIPDWLTPGFLKKKVGFSLETEGTAKKVRIFEAGGLKLGYSEDRIVEGRLTKKGMIFDEILVHSIVPALENGPAAGFGEKLFPLSPVENEDGALAFTSFGESRGVRYSARWKVFPDGAISVKAKLKALDASSKQRLGFTFSAPVSSFKTWEGETLEWFGLGPRATSPADRDGAFLGRWEMEISASPFLFTAEEVRGARLGGFTVRTLGSPFAIRAEQDSLSVFAEPDSSGEAAISFTVSINDKSLTAQTPSDGKEIPQL